VPKAVDDALARSRTLAIELVPQAADGEVSELERLDNGARLEHALAHRDALAATIEPMLQRDGYRVTRLW